MKITNFHLQFPANLTIKDSLDIKLKPNPKTLVNDIQAAVKTTARRAFSVAEVKQIAQKSHSQSKEKL
jgi:hypothetical protein